MTSTPNNPNGTNQSNRTNGRGRGRSRGRGRGGGRAPSENVNSERTNGGGRGRGGRNGRGRDDHSSSSFVYDDRPGNNGNLDVSRSRNSNGGRQRGRQKSKQSTDHNQRVDRQQSSQSSSSNHNSNLDTSDSNRNDKQPSNNDNRNSNHESVNNNNQSTKRRARTKKTLYPPHAPLSTCLSRYNSSDPSLIRGKLRVMPSRNGVAFVSCDRGSLSVDVLIEGELSRNRGLDGDVVFVELLPNDDDENDNGGGGGKSGDVSRGDAKCGEVTLDRFMEQLELNDAADGFNAALPNEVPNGECYEQDVEYEEEEYLIDEQVTANQCNQSNNDPAIDESTIDKTEMWHDDAIQMSLWNPTINLPRKSKSAPQQNQRKGRVVCIVPPKSNKSELTPSDEGQHKVACRTIVGTLSRLQDDKYLLVPNNKCLPRFLCPSGTAEDLKLNKRGSSINNGDNNNDCNGDNNNNDSNDTNNDSNTQLYRATYTPTTWGATHKWPPCTNLTPLCGSANVEDETRALLVEFDVDHGEFEGVVLREVDAAVASGRFVDKHKSNKGGSSNESNDDGGESLEEMGWKPTPSMLKNRRDYRNHRVFTIDPTTARDLDDALHITPLPDGRVEIGVHIADVSHFVSPGSAVDQEALRRATTVYLVDRVIPMLPRPLCEIACSLNENVERLAFSCVWTMNMDGTMGKKNEVWYGRTVIKSCARLDYATAQNIIDGKVATGEDSNNVDESLWPKSRRPTGGHSIDEVAADIRLMHKVAMARRKLRFENGALALNGIKMAFQLEEDGETPRMAAPYPIRDSNRLIEEYMLLANFLVAQRLITHAKGRALLRQHCPPLEAGLQNVVEVSKESFNFDIDVSSSQTLQESLSRLSRTCPDELVIQCVTESLMAPMRPAEYIAAGEVGQEDWQHFALNIPYYTHFTSPIRRYADVIVHRLLQATLDGSVDECLSQKEIHADAMHCNDKRMASKKAQERSDRVFLSLFLKKNPMSSVLGVCLGIGEKTFTVFVPSLGLSTRVFLEEHTDLFEINTFDDGGRRRLVIRPKNVVPGMQIEDYGTQWKCLDVKVFTKLAVSCFCKERSPIDVKVMVVGPWVE